MHFSSLIFNSPMDMFIELTGVSSACSSVKSIWCLACLLGHLREIACCEKCRKKKMTGKGGGKGQFSLSCRKRKDHWDEQLKQNGNEKLHIPFILWKSKEGKSQVILAFNNLRITSLYFWTVELCEWTMQKHCPLTIHALNLNWASTAVGPHWVYPRHSL